MKAMNWWEKSLKNNYKNKRVMSRRYSSAGPHNKSFMCRHYHGAYFVYLFALLVTGVALLNSNSVFAAPGTLTISIPDTISLDVLPSASGTFASTSSNITVRTTYAHGYTLGIAAKTANSNALINTNDSSKTIPSITSSVSESDFSSSTSYNNKWGYSPSKYNSTTNTNYLVAPTSTTMATLDKTSAANSTNNTYTIKLGARIDGTLAPGTYENTFVFTVTPNATPYTINYNANTTDTVTNMPTPNPQTGETFATTVNISNTVPARDGYLFKGWCTVAVADGATCSGTTYNPDGGGTSLSWTIDQTAVTNTLNLYAMWEVDAIDMQTMKDTDCVASAPTRVRDVRDGEIYLVQRLADGNCWLLDNLRLDPTATPLATLIGNTNASSQTLTYFKNGGGSSPYAVNGVNTTWSSSSDDKYDEPKVVTTYKDTTTTSYGAGSGKIGVYYNYCAASAGSYCYASGAGTGSVTEDICPVGWRMPTSGDDGEYRALCTAYNGGVDCASGASITTMDATSTSSLQYNLSTPLSGVFKSGSASGQGTGGIFHSSTPFLNTPITRSLEVSPSGVVPSFSRVQPTSSRSDGETLRCVKKTAYMQDVTDMDLEEMIPDPGDTVTLADKRDSTKYLVGRLADGNVWMLDNLALDPTAVSEATLKGNTNASDTTIGYLKNGGGSSPYPATGVNTTWASSSDRKYDEPKVVTTYKDTTTTSYGAGSGKIGVYYNFCAASAGSYCYPSSSGIGDATEDLCPAGWRMPTGAENGGYHALYTAYNADAASFRNALSTPLSGDFNNGSAEGQGARGTFWSSTMNSGSSMYGLIVSSSNVNPTNNDNRRSGYSMRCVKKTPYMQDISYEELENLIHNVGDVAILADKRDNNKYKVTLFGEVYWMLDNLRLDPTTVPLATLQGNTNASNQTLTYFKNGGGTSPYPATGVSTTWNFAADEPLVNTDYKDTVTTSFGVGSGKIGVYYNYCAASAGSYCYASGAATGDAAEDLCPTGWAMPRGDYSYGSYDRLYYETFGADDNAFMESLSTPLSGYFYGGTADQGTEGSFWSSSAGIDGDAMMGLKVRNGYVNPTVDGQRDEGWAVRCAYYQH